MVNLGYLIFSPYERGDCCNFMREIEQKPKTIKIIGLLTSAVKSRLPTRLTECVRFEEQINEDHLLV